MKKTIVSFILLGSLGFLAIKGINMLRKDRGLGRGYGCGYNRGLERSRGYGNGFGRRGYGCPDSAARRFDGRGQGCGDGLGKFKELNPNCPFNNK